MLASKKYGIHGRTQKILHTGECSGKIELMLMLSCFSALFFTKAFSRRKIHPDEILIYHTAATVMLVSNASTSVELFCQKSY